jgi:hypothetical protein
MSTGQYCGDLDDASDIQVQNPRLLKLGEYVGSMCRYVMMFVKWWCVLTKAQNKDQDSDAHTGVHLQDQGNGGQGALCQIFGCSAFASRFLGGGGTFEVDAGASVGGPCNEWYGEEVVAWSKFSGTGCHG